MSNKAQDEKLLSLLLEQNLITANQETRLRTAMGRGSTLIDAIGKTPLVDPLRLASLQGIVAQQLETKTKATNLPTQSLPPQGASVITPPPIPKIPPVPAPPKSPMSGFDPTPLHVDSDFELPPDFSDVDLEFEVLEDSGKTPLPQPVMASPVADLDSDLDIDHDLDLDEDFELPPPAPSPASAPTANLPAAGDDLDLDFEFPEPIATPSSKSAVLSPQPLTQAIVTHVDNVDNKDGHSADPEGQAPRKVADPGPVDDYISTVRNPPTIDLAQDDGIDLIAKVNTMLADGIKLGLSAIEIEPDLPKKNIRQYNAVGELIEETNHDSDTARKYVNRLRSMARMAPLVGEPPTHGQCLVEVDGQRIRALLRVSESPEGNEQLTCYFTEP